jgi:NADPH:quinone reductase-like Zn-dependent oxidoreductase
MSTKKNKAIQFAQFGIPSEVAEVVELPEPGDPGPGEVVVEVEVAPIEPADLYRPMGLAKGFPTSLPFIGGLEGMGRVATVGAGVNNVHSGDHVLLPIAVGSWQQRVRVSAQTLFPLPLHADPLQLGQLSVNPPTAYLLLKEFVPLASGDWFIHNAATSNLASYLIGLGNHLGFHFVNLVRHESAIERLHRAGADVVLVDGPDLAQRVAATTNNAPIQLALDAIGGEATMRLASCLTDGGTLVVYGMLSGQPCQVPPPDLLFKDIRLQGFFLARWFQNATPADIAQVFQTVIPLVANGTLRSEVEATYPLDQIKEALAHASREGRKGRILLTLNGTPK